MSTPSGAVGMEERELLIHVSFAIEVGTMASWGWAGPQIVADPLEEDPSEVPREGVPPGASDPMGDEISN